MLHLRWSCFIWLNKKLSYQGPTGGMMPLATGSMYIKKHFKKETKDSAMEMTELIRWQKFLYSPIELSTCWCLSCEMSPIWQIYLWKKWQFGRTKQALIGKICKILYDKYPNFILRSQNLCIKRNLFASYIELYTLFGVKLCLTCLLRVKIFTFHNSEYTYFLQA